MHLTVYFVVAFASMFPSEGCQCRFPNRYYHGRFDILVQDDNDKSLQHSGYNGTFSVDVDGYYFKANLVNHDRLGDLQLFARNRLHLACYKNFDEDDNENCDRNPFGTLLRVFPSCIPDQATYDASKNEYVHTLGKDVQRYVVEMQSDGTCKPISATLMYYRSGKRTYVYDNLMVDSARDESYYSDPLKSFTTINVNLG